MNAKPALAATLAFAAACATPAPSTAPSAAAHDDVPAALQACTVTAAMGSPHAGEAMPAFDVAGFDGGVIHSSAFAGKPLFLHFTATWCPYCREEIGTVANIAKQSGGKGNVVLVDVKEDRARWEKFGGVTEPALTVGLDDDGTLATKFSPPQARPFLERYEVPIQGTLLVDEHGVIRLFVLGDNNGYDPNLPEIRAIWAAMIGVPAATTAAAPAPTTTTAAAKTSSPSPSKERPHITIAPGQAGADPTGAGSVDVAIDVPAGFHIMSNAPLDPALIATTLTLDETDVKDVKVAWPAPAKAQVGTQQLAVFEGHVVAHVTFQMRVTHPNAPLVAHVVVNGAIRYQMCDAGTCYMPQTAKFNGP